MSRQQKENMTPSSHNSYDSVNEVVQHLSQGLVEKTDQVRDCEQRCVRINVLNQSKEVHDALSAPTYTACTAYNLYASPHASQMRKRTHASYWFVSAERSEETKAAKHIGKSLIGPT
ncbi:hypothetical protein CYMTET_42656 [Cymbomonas tetramitiformis]|uniref:Uncharacterized protein n=1 Tax=Cymbomonas tetramitiformis TaxID=36881 RepID=A0AAE0C3U9_9CHLO|nr:hypothetical protein CYMTET_42656 [Cymbomonas tetramitiformis]